MEYEVITTTNPSNAIRGLKQLSLLFNKVGLVDLDLISSKLRILAELNRRSVRDVTKWPMDLALSDWMASELDSLKDNGFVYCLDVNKFFDAKNIDQEFVRKDTSKVKAILQVLTQMDKLPKENSWNVFMDLLARYIALYKRLFLGHNSVALLHHAPPEHFGSVNREDVVGIVLQNVPLPSDEVPWDELKSIREDGDLIRRRTALRRWISQTSRLKLSHQEIQEELLDNMHAYEEYFSINKLKNQTGILEVLVTASAEAIEHLTRLRFSKVAEAAFTIRKRKIAFLEADLKSPGREISYLIHLKYHFD